MKRVDAWLARFEYDVSPCRLILGFVLGAFVAGIALVNAIACERPPASPADACVEVVVAPFDASVREGGGK